MLKARPGAEEICLGCRFLRYMRVVVEDERPLK